MVQAPRFWIIVLAVSLTALLAGMEEARAEFTLGLEVRETYEDNVIGLTADNPNIISTTANAVAGEVTGATTVAPTDQRGSGPGSGEGKHGLHMRKGGGELNNIPNPQQQQPISGTTTTTPAAGGGTITAGDFSTSFSVDAGLSHDVGARTTLLLLAGVEHTGYSRYNQFDFTIAALSAGAAVNLTDDLTAKALLRSAVKKFKNSDRNSYAYGGSLSLKERFSRSFWVKGVYDVEQNNADFSFDSYLGNSYSVWAGYALTAKTSAGAGFSYLTRDFKSTDFRLTSKTVSVDWTWEFVDRWSVNVGFDQERGDSNVPGSATIDNIYSVGLLYSY